MLDAVASLVLEQSLSASRTIPRSRATLAYEAGGARRARTAQRTALQTLAAVEVALVGTLQRAQLLFIAARAGRLPSPEAPDPPRPSGAAWSARDTSDSYASSHACLRQY